MRIFEHDKHIEELKGRKSFKSLHRTFYHPGEKRAKRWMLFILSLFIIILFLPWTQNISGTGIITTLKPEQRPQEINSIISGRIEKWFVREGDMVKKGDTILKISEVKEEYLDPALVNRTDEQLQSKGQSVENYRSKLIALQNQLNALIEGRELKLEQLRNKVKQSALYIESDSMSYLAAITQLKIADDQYKRYKTLYEDGLISKTDLERREQSLQEAKAKKINAENKFYNSKNDYLIARIELSSTDREYQEKIAKTESEKFQTASQIYSGQAEVAKLQNQVANYSIRNGFYFITAPQSGQITKTVRAGIGEVIKEGELLLQVVPNEFDFAVEMYVSPNDMPLIHKGEKVRFLFDGWPAIVFSGWPNVSYGTFGGIISAIDNNISPNGKYRILVAEDINDKRWPKALRVGGGAKGLAFLNNVPIWYELWRKLNGFPADFYKPGTENEKEKVNDEKK